MLNKPTCWIIAGPNGAGKTTFALKHLPDVDLSLKRVAERVAHGGHSVPEDIIVRRYPRSLHNLFECYTYVVSSTRCFLNSSDLPEPVFTQESGELEILDQAAFDLLKSKAKS